MTNDKAPVSQSAHSVNKSTPRPIYARCPVPWCDSDKVSARHFDAKRRKHWLECNDCGFSTPQMPSLTKAENLWNTRIMNRNHTTSLTEAELLAMDNCKGFAL